MLSVKKLLGVNSAPLAQHLEVSRPILLSAIGWTNMLIWLGETNRPLVKVRRLK